MSANLPPGPLTRNPGDAVRLAVPPEWWLQAIYERTATADADGRAGLVALLLAVLRLLAANL
jgi:hypothetical protein